MSDDLNDRAKHESQDGETGKKVGGGTDRKTGGYHENNFHDSRRSRLHRNRDTVWIAGEEWAVDTLRDLERIRRERYAEFAALSSCLRDDTRQGIVTAILRSSPQSYSELAEWAGVTERTIKNHVYDLQDAGVLTVEGNPAGVTFSDEEVRLLASDVLSFLD